jgi:hypothetical protein
MVSWTSRLLLPARLSPLLKGCSPCSTNSSEGSSREPLAFDGSQLTPAVGRYTYMIAGDNWLWTEGMYLLHGCVPGEIDPSTELLRRHKHPDDRSRTVAVLETAIEDGEPFSCYHRIIDRHKRLRSV